MTVSNFAIMPRDPHTPMPGDFQPLETADGTFTLRSGTLGEQYHSVHGAVQECRHVFIEAGLLACSADPVDLLEVGLGTGLNALLTWVEAERSGRTVRYHALEPYPVPLELLRQVDHPRRIGTVDRADGYYELMTAPDEAPLQLSPFFRFERSSLDVRHLNLTEAYDLVYFHAFGPEVQPELWSADVLQRVFNSLRPGGMLVTYCSKGQVRRTLQGCGFRVERLTGPPGKIEMLRATRPSQ